MTFVPGISVTNNVATAMPTKKMVINKIVRKKKYKYKGNKRSNLFTGSQRPLIKDMDNSIAPCQKALIQAL